MGELPGGSRRSSAPTTRTGQPLNIAINTLSVTDDNEGIRTMICGLVPALVRNDAANRYRIICSRANEHFFSSLVGRVDTTVVRERRRRPLVRIFHDQVTVPWVVRRDADILLTPSTVGSVAAPVRQVVVVVAHLALPSVRREAGDDSKLSGVHRAYYGPLMRWSHRRADAVVAISNFVADRLISDTGLAPAKVHPILCGIDPVAKPDAVGRDILFVSTLYPYKNATGLLRAFALARARLPADVKLVVVGRDPDGAQVPGLRRLAVDLGVADAVTLTGKVGDAELERLYGRAAAVVFPSRAEGFGFAALEAMARGIPVIASNRASFPEVVGDAGVLVDPDATHLLAGALVEVLTDEARRNRLREAGRQRAAQLSWDDTAHAFIDLFSKVGR